jgi:hypothetical protein
MTSRLGVSGGAVCVLFALAMLWLAGPAVAGTTIVGEQVLSANGGLPAATGQDIPVFQGAASANYVLVSPRTGVITSWSFMSAGVEHGTPYVLRVLAPAGSGTWRAAATSKPVQLSSVTGNDEQDGPFPDSIPIAAGEAIAIQPTDSDGDTPIEQGISGMDGIRYFAAPFEDGSIAALAPGSEMDNGQVVPVQATVEFTEAPAAGTVVPPAPPQSASLPSITGVARSGNTLTCNPGDWSSATTPTFTYQWLWSGSSPIPPFRTAAKRPAIGIPRRSIVLHPDGAEDTFLVPLTAAQSILVPELPATGSTFECLVTASAGGETAQAETPPLSALPSPPKLALFKHKVQAPPRITVGVGVGGTNVCAHGTWAGYPTAYTYAWYRPRPARERDLLLHRGQTYMPTPEDETHEILCVVTASNKAGSATAASNLYTVVPDSPIALTPPFVEVHTAEPTEAPGLIGPEGGSVIAEQVHLTCLPGRWNRGDITTTTGWVPLSVGAPSPGATTGSSGSANGTQLELDMRPGKLQYNMTAECVVLARTKRGVASVTRSGPIEVWNGCLEKIVTLEGGVAVRSSSLLYALPYALTGPGVIAAVGVELGVDSGVLGLFGVEYKGLGSFESLGSGSETIVETFGPNCGDYHAYWEAQGFTVRQQD